jgi:predicted nucleic-acid-binding protein
MIGLDTDVLVRYLTQDDLVQSTQANAFIERQLSPAEPGIIGNIVLCEVGCVLSRAYGYTREQVAEALGSLLTCREFRIESPDLGILALLDYRHGTADFSDYLLGRAHQRLGGRNTFTLDRKGAQAPQFTLLA